MILRDIFAFVTSSSTQQHVTSFAQALAEQNAGRMTAVLVNWMPPVLPIDGFVAGPLYSQLVQDAQKHLADVGQKMFESLKRGAPDARFDSCLLELSAAGSELGERARHGDVSIVSRPDKADGNSAHALLEGVMFESGRPLIVVPAGWKPRPIGGHVLVAWKSTREAARAIADADDLLMNARSVSVVTVDAKPGQGYGEQPGADITAHLSFRGARAQLFNVDSMGRSETAAILDQARSVDADIIVMGGYGRPRLSEMIFGGVTREMLWTADVPVFLAH